MHDEISSTSIIARYRPHVYQATATRIGTIFGEDVTVVAMKEINNFYHDNACPTFFLEM